MTKDHSWMLLEEPWRMALTQAWEAFVGGNVGVGAVLTDAGGKIVAVGRNRQADIEAPPGRLRSTAIAHAELDVLAQLARGDYQHHTLWTTLEPCPLCSMAIVFSNIGNVAFAAKDPLWDEIATLMQRSEFIATRWPNRRGPLDGAVSAFCELLPLLWFVEHKPNGSVMAKYRSQHPKLLALAKRISSESRLAQLKADSVEVAFDTLWTELSSIGER